MFFRISAMDLSTKFFSPPIAAALMRSSPFLAMMVSTAILIVCLPLLLLLPETLNYHTKQTSTTQTRPPSPKPKRTRQNISQLIRNLPTTLRALRTHLATSTSFLTSSRSLLLLLPAYTPHLLIPSALALLPQYASARFALPLSTSTLLTSLQALLIVTTLLLPLPLLTHHLTHRRHLPPAHADLLLARLSALALLLGFVLVGLAPSLALLLAALPVALAGYGAMVLVRSVATSLVERHRVARLYALLGVCEVAGMMAGGPALAKLFDVGLRVGGAWMGLPFFGVAGLMGGLVGVLAGVRVGGEKGEVVEGRLEGGGE